jgi:hypothetical protein
MTIVPMNDFNPDAADLSDVMEAGKLFGLLQSYCNSKALAMKHRAGGSLRWAKDAERDCDMIYKSLPNGWRW